MKIAILSLLLSTAALAQTCDYYPLNTCAQNILGKKTFYDGISVPGGIITDGGTTIQNLTVTGDAGIAGNVAVGGDLSVSGPSGIGVANGILAGGQLVVTYAALDGGVSRIYASLAVGGDAGIGGSVSVGGTVTLLGSLNAVDAGFLNITAIDGGFQSLAVLGSTVATAANGQAGGQATGVLVEADLVATHGDEIIGSQILRHPIVTDAGSVAVAITKAGTTGGTFNVYLKNATNGQILCFDNGVSCTTAAGVVTVSCTLDAGVIGDQIDVHANTTSCTGNDPTAFVTFSW